MLVGLLLSPNQMRLLQTKKAVSMVTICHVTCHAQSRRRTVDHRTQVSIYNDQFSWNFHNYYFVFCLKCNSKFWFICESFGINSANIPKILQHFHEVSLKIPQSTAHSASTAKISCWKKELITSLTMSESPVTSAPLRRVITRMMTLTFYFTEGMSARILSRRAWE